MAEIQSALASVYEVGRKGIGTGEASVSIKEITGRDIVQLAAWPDTVTAAAKKAAKTVGHALPGDTHAAASKGKTSVFRIAPEKFLIVCPLRARMGEALRKAFKAEQAVVTDLGHSRTIIRISGAAARDVLSRGVAADLDAGQFAQGTFVQTGIHSIATICHRSGRDQFDLIVARNFAVNIYEWLEETSAQFGYVVEEAGA